MNSRSQLRNIKVNRKYLAYWLMALPGIVFYFLFAYLPMYGVQIAFRDYTFLGGIWGSEFVGFDNFRSLFQTSDFWRALKNTLIISAGRLLFEFPFPIVLAILLSEIKHKRTKKLYQTAFTFPHFISWVVAYGILFNLLATGGFINQVIVRFGGEPIKFFTNPQLFLPLIFITNLWKTLGWSSIIYLAAISGLDPNIYEAAMMDGANRFRKIYHIVLPGMMPVVSIMLLLAIGNIMNAGFDQIFNMYSPNVYQVGDILDTYVYRLTFGSSGSYSLSTAAGLFKSTVNFVLLITADRIVRRMGQSGLWG